MNITFLNNLPLPALLGLVLAIAGLLVFAYYQFSIPTRKRTRLLLAFLRALLILLTLFLILDPYWNRSSDADWMGAVADTSASMNIKDFGLEENRMDMLRSYFEKNAYWKDLQKHRIRKFQTIDEKFSEVKDLSGLNAEGSASKLFSAVQEIENRYRDDENLMGWILFSDGAATDLPDAKKAALADAGIPWILVGMGLEEEIPNVRLKHPLIRDPIFVGDLLKTSIEWESNLPPKTATLLSIRLDGKPLIEKNVMLEDKKYELEWMLTESGNHFLEINLAPLGEEGSGVDNTLRIGLRAHPRQTRVFYAESFYKEKNYFKEALEEDESFKVTFVSSLVGFSRKHKVPFIKDPIYGFPRTRSELFQYDAVVLSDVKRQLLTNEQIDWIRDLVEKEGGAFVMVGGVDSFGDGGYVDTPIEKMLPVEISEDYKQKNFLKTRGVNEHPFRVILTEDGIKHPVLRILEDSEANKILWQNMPLLGGYNNVGRVKPAAAVLLEHPSDKSSFGPRPILAVQNFGTGKVLAFTSDVTPNWGQWFQEWKSEEDGWVYARFWRSALKWLTENRIRGRASLVAIQRELLLAETMKPLKFTVSFPERGPLDGHAELKLEIFKNRDFVLAETFQDPESSQIVWTIPHLEAGDYVIKALYSLNGQLPIIAEMPFAVHPTRVEAENLKPNHAFLKAIADETQGVYLPFNKIGDLDQAMKTLGKVHLRQRSTPFWTHGLFYLAFLGILCLDWFIRKKQGLE